MIALHQLIFSMSFGMQNPLGSSFYENKLVKYGALWGVSLPGIS
jgi:hypothetical protein